MNSDCRTAATRVAACGMLLALVGCATLPPGAQPDPRDPWERVNRATFRFNETMDRAIGKPVARAYIKVVPRPLRASVTNVLENAKYPGVIVSQLLQGKLRDTGRDTGRLLINTLVGVGGLFDVATDVGLDAHDEDFGQVLGRWGVRSGPYLMLPVLGPSSLRDTIGEIPDQFTNASHYLKDDTARYSVTALRLVDDRAGLVEGEKLVERAADPYVLVRSAWLQRREYLVTDGAATDSPADFEDPEPEADAESADEPAQ